MTNLREDIKKLLDEMSREIDACPVNSSPKAFDGDCPDCGNGPSHGCPKTHLAEYHFITEVRKLVEDDDT